MFSKRWLYRFMAWWAIVMGTVAVDRDFGFRLAALPFELWFLVTASLPSALATSLNGFVFPAGAAYAVAMGLGPFVFIFGGPI